MAGDHLKPGDPNGSEIYQRLISEDPDEVMPPPESHLKLTQQEIGLIRQWIEQGGVYEKHWAFRQIPKQMSLPSYDEDDWSRTGLDSWVYWTLKKANQTPAEEVAPELWLRRVYVALTGLPPAEKDLDQFLQERSGGKEKEEMAAAKVVDRLLSSKSHAEHLAAKWMDTARYADTFGYQNDMDMDMWPWRDWVIEAFRKNMPYDQFILWQIAGDLLEKPTLSSRLATGFNRLHRQTNEGGSVDEEFRLEYVSDRVHTLGTAFLGLTLECARCHDHKFDPISTNDYYSLSAFFDQIDESGLYSHFTRATPTPALDLFDEAKLKQHQGLLRDIKDLELQLDKVKQRVQASAHELMEVKIPEDEFHESFDTPFKSSGNIQVEGRVGKAIQFSGDDALKLPKGIGSFERTQPFTIALWMKPAEFKERQVIWHRSVAWSDAGSRGYELLLEDGKPSVGLIHFWPGNAIRIRARQAMELNRWSHVAVTYDGSSKASGVSLFIDGKRIHEVDVVRDGLTRGITYRKAWGDSGDDVTLSLGARFRDVGFAGGAVDELYVFSRVLSRLEVAKLAMQPSSENVDDLREHEFLVNNKTAKFLRLKLGRLQEAEDALISSVQQVMCMEESPSKRPTYVLNRGDYQAKGVEVHPDVPSAILPMSPDLPRNRLGLAKWLISENHPLTARVAVNGFWSMLFGLGLVKTPEDFGLQSAIPKHAELLDWLARRFMDTGWDVRALLKEIALSSTFRMSSVPQRPEDWLRDPDNEWLARGPKYRLTAEMLRDQAWFVSGLLVDRVGGPSVKPYQIPGLYEESGASGTYEQSKGENLYRRSLYTYWKRTMPSPLMMTFDTTTREVCTVKREVTVTPMQALATLNDTTFQEAARVWAERLCSSYEQDLGKRWRHAFRQGTSRWPNPAELDAMTKVYDSQVKFFEQTPQAIESILRAGNSPNVPMRGKSKMDVAATSIVLLTILNSDASMVLR